MKPLEGKIAIVAGATRGAGRGIACMLGEAGATVYCTGRSVRGEPATGERPETIEETAERVTARGGAGIAAQVDHTVEGQVKSLISRVREEQGRLHVLVNDIWGGDDLTEFGKPFWQVSLEKGRVMLERFGVSEENWRDGAKRDPNFSASETPYFVGRAVAALAVDPQVSKKSGRVFSSWELAREYGFTDIDGSRPDWGKHFEEKYGELRRCDDGFYAYCFGGPVDILLPDWP